VIIQGCHGRRLAADLAVLRAIVAAGETYAFPTDLTLDTGAAVVDGAAARADRGRRRGGRRARSAKMGPNRPARGSHVATASFMVDPAAQGKGVGRALGTYVVELARAAGYRSMQFNAVVETNVAAVALWQALGFEILTTVPEAFDHPAHGLVGLHVMFQRF
jgi:GNAT superfamily N-acetyltransferase